MPKEHKKKEIIEDQPAIRKKKISISQGWLTTPAMNIQGKGFVI